MCPLCCRNTGQTLPAARACCSKEPSGESAGVRGSRSAMAEVTAERFRPPRAAGQGDESASPGAPDPLLCCRVQDIAPPIEPRQLTRTEVGLLSYDFPRDIAEQDKCRYVRDRKSSAGTRQTQKMAPRTKPYCNISNATYGPRSSGCIISQSMLDVVSATTFNNTACRNLSALMIIANHMKDTHGVRCACDLKEIDLFLLLISSGFPSDRTPWLFDS